MPWGAPGAKLLCLHTELAKLETAAAVGTLPPSYMSLGAAAQRSWLYMHRSPT